jgi:hypothetical protein
MVTVGRKVRFVFLIVAVFSGGVMSVLAHSVVGIQYRDVHKALVQSPTIATDLPVPIFNTGLSVACFRVTNQSTVDSNITALGLEIPDVPDEINGFALVSPVDRGWTLQEDVQVPGVPGVTLDFAVMTGGNFTGGHHRLGIPTGEPGPTRICVSGPFNVPPQAPKTIETLLNGVFLAFKGGQGASNVLDVGVWVTRL